MGKILELFKADIERRRADDKIVKVEMIDSITKKSTASAITRGLVGGAVFGAAGLVGGAVSGKNKDEAVFKIEYASGRVELRTCKKNSREYKELLTFKA